MESLVHLSIYKSNLKVPMFNLVCDLQKIFCICSTCCAEIFLHSVSYITLKLPGFLFFNFIFLCAKEIIPFSKKNSVVVSCKCGSYAATVNEHSFKNFFL